MSHYLDRKSALRFIPCVTIFAISENMFTFVA